jgi:hypothetical protein
MSLRDPRQKEAELTQYRDLVIATLDYYLDNQEFQIKSAAFDSRAYYQDLKTQAEAHFKKGRLTLLKQWFRDLTEMPIEERDLKFNKYLQDKTGYDIDIFMAFFQRIDKVINKGKISTDNQFYDIRIMADHLCQNDPVDEEKVVLLNRLLQEYEQRKARNGM